MPILILGIVEGVMLMLAVYAGTLIRFDGDWTAVANSVGLLFPRALAFVVIVIGCMVAMGLYHVRHQPHSAGVLIRIAASLVLASIAMAIIFYFMPFVYLGRGALALATFIAFVLLLLTRLVFYRTLDDEIFKRRVLVYGAGRKAASIGQLRARQDQRGYRTVGYIKAEGDELSVDDDMLVHINPNLTRFARENDIDEIVVAVDDRRQGLPVESLLDCKTAGVAVVDLLSFIERETGKVKINLLYPSWLIFSDGFSRNTVQLMIERVFDVVAASLLLLITWPVMLATVLAIRLEDGPGAPYLYRQIRVGYEGRQFAVLKFRSMRVDAEKGGRAVWAKENDDRITRVGRFIRKYRIDELPQIFNVLRGDMSFVGPRPERPQFVEELSAQIPYYRERHCVKPGITGWAQLCYPYGASMEDATEKLQYDLYYVKNHSVLFDLMILLQTAEVVLWGQGSR